MSKRAVVSVLWFAAVWVSYEVIWSVTGVPRLIGPVVAAAVAGFVGADPMRLFHAVPDRTRSTSVATSRTLVGER
jgi:hypothetical protein